MDPLHHLPNHDLNPHQRAELGSLKCASFHATLRRENPDLAYLLGAWTANTAVGGQPDSRISYASKDPKQLTLVEEPLTRLAGKAPYRETISLHGVLYQRTTLHNEEVAHHFQRVTAYNSRVPWEHLGTQQECIYYLRGIFDHGGWIFTGPSAGIGFNKSEGDHLLRDIARVCAKVGLLPLVSYGKVPSLRFKERTEWSLFASTIQLSLPERQQEAQALASTPSKKNHFGLDDYAAVTRSLESGRIAARDITHDTGVPTNTVRDWIIRGQKPPVVKRKEIIDAFSEKMANPDVISFVYRHLGASSALARECGLRTSLNKVTDIARQERENIERIYGDDARLAELLLGAWAMRCQKPLA